MVLNVRFLTIIPELFSHKQSKIIKNSLIFCENSPGIFFRIMVEGNRFLRVPERSFLAVSSADVKSDVFSKLLKCSEHRRMELVTVIQNKQCAVKTGDLTIVRNKRRPF